MGQWPTVDRVIDVDLLEIRRSPAFHRLDNDRRHWSAGLLQIDQRQQVALQLGMSLLELRRGIQLGHAL